MTKSVCSIVLDLDPALKIFSSSKIESFHPTDIPKCSHDSAVEGPFHPECQGRQDPRQPEGGEERRHLVWLRQ